MAEEPQQTTQFSESNLTNIDPHASARRIMTMSGYLLLVFAAGLVAWIAYRSLNSDIPNQLHDEPLIAWVLQSFGSYILILIGSMFLGIAGLRLLGAAGKAAPKVIPPEDRNLLEPLIRDANKDAISQYVILSSLNGFTGNFQQIGFSGLPLATVTLTLIFSALSFVNPEFMELAKLTLGAFIGSFVQKGTDDSKLPSIKWGE